MILLLAMWLAATPATEQFDRAKIAYDRNEYGRVVALLRPLLYPSIQLASPAQVSEAHRLLGVALLKTGDSAGARREFAVLLSDNPEFSIDRIVEGAEVARFVDRIKQEMKQQLDRIRELERQRQEEERGRKTAEEAERRRRAERIYLEVRVIEHPYFVNFLPFGAGQFQNGQKGKGTSLLVAGALLATTSLALWIAQEQTYPDAKVHLPRQSPDAATAMEVTRISTGGLFLALWAVGIIDALRHYTPRTIRTLPLTATPTLIPQGAGLGVEGRF